MRSENEGCGRILLAGLATIALVFLAVGFCYRLPAPKLADAPANEFSAARAREIVRQLVGEGIPHPVGSAADAVVRERILTILRDAGYAPSVQSAFSCDRWGICADVQNIIARLPGSEPGPAILLASHYDSVPAGPGASDDGSGTAVILEIARALKHQPPLRHSVIILIDEGEEAGLLGAQAFIDEHPWAKEARAVVNIDSRGTSGPSFMFETGSANDWLIKLYASAVPRPFTNSIYYAVYKLLPNDTDFTIFKAAGLQGFNFAQIEDPAQYHTPLDNFEDASPATLQHHGDNALAAFRALAQSGLENPPPGEAVYFDVLARWLMHWTPAWSLGFSIALLICFALFVLLGHPPAAQILWGLLSFPAMLIAAAVAALALQWILAAHAFPAAWIAHPLPALIAFWALAFATVSALAVIFGRRAGFWGLWVGCWMWMSVLAVLVSWVFPGASFIPVVSAGIAGVVGLPMARANAFAWKRFLAATLPAAALALLALESAWFLYAALGTQFFPVIGLVAALIAISLAPLTGSIAGLWRWALPTTAALIALVAAATAFAVAPFTPNTPEPMSIVYRQDADTGKSQWLLYPAAPRVLREMQAVAGFRSEPVAPLPGTERALSADAPHLDVPAPSLEIQHTSRAGAITTIRALLRSTRGASAVGISFPPDSRVASFAMHGYPLPPLWPKALQYYANWTQYECVTVPPKGIEVSFTLPAGKPVDALLIDESPGLPLEGFFLQKARPATATPFQDGDKTVATRHILLKP